MIEFELPCCGDVARLVDLSDEIRCERCGIVAELAPDRPPVVPARVAVAASAAPVASVIAA